ncbi:HAD-IB family hydrolase [Flocculibacter collagenilyticus]|uniref:HAD-IB family hydrolase n=1 Tax=Flocculibacter collagenilyticus TaxID=2744479 RepID=UPI0018F2D8AD|nr:HAD-IB family hydrolase [Flocculibacter collagenilyticus]
MTRSNKPNLALFDFDGTLTTTDTYSTFIKRILNSSPYTAKTIWRKLCVIPVLFCYKLGLISATHARVKSSFIVLKGLSTSTVEETALQYVDDLFPHIIRPEIYECLQLHKQQNDTVVIVSASLDVYLKVWCKRNNLKLLCSQLETAHLNTNDEIYTGEYLGADCCGEEKARRIQQHFPLHQYNTIYAYGDTPEDYPMLSLAHHHVYQGNNLNRIKSLISSKLS